MEGEPVTAEENRMEGESVSAVENEIEGAPVTGDENANTSWVVELEKMLADGEPSHSVESARWREQSIYRVPKLIKDMNSKAYQPQLVSLGPFHHGNSNLLPMEEHKRRALVHRVKRSGKPLQDFIAAVEEVADKLEAAYGKDLDDRWRGENRHRFVEMMVTDGCFLLEILMDLRDYEPRDPFFGTNGRFCYFPYVWYDMFVMENQLPLLLLDRLVAVGSDSDSDIPLVGERINRLVLKYIGRPFQDVEINHLPLKLHPLDLYYTCLVDGANQDPGSPLDSKSKQGRSQNCCRPRVGPSNLCITSVFHGIFYYLPVRFFGWVSSYCSRGSRPSSTPEFRYVIMPSAVKIHESGIEFKKSDTNSLKDIHFEHGVLSMPVVVVDDSTEYLFLNLMAFERLHVAVGTLVMDYVIFMDNIIDSVEDVALLRSKEVLESFLGSNEEVATLFNGTLTRGTMVGDSTKLHKLQCDVMAYCKKPWNNRRADLIQKYFRNPWAFISLVAAAILLAATLLQTVFTVIQFKSKP